MALNSVIGKPRRQRGDAGAAERLASDNEIGLMGYLREHAPASQTA